MKAVSVAVDFDRECRSPQKTGENEFDLELYVDHVGFAAAVQICTTTAFEAGRLALRIFGIQVEGSEHGTLDIRNVEYFVVIQVAGGRGHRNFGFRAVSDDLHEVVGF